MGRPHYGSSQVFEFDDLVLAHIRSIVFSKFNHQESFGLTWISDGQQRSVWLHPSTDVVFEFDEPTTPELDHEWLSEMRARQEHGSACDRRRTARGEGDPQEYIAACRP